MGPSELGTYVKEIHDKVYDIDARTQVMESHQKVQKEDLETVEKEVKKLEAFANKTKGGVKLLVLIGIVLSISVGIMKLQGVL